jgi:hypothetical protein
MKSSSSFLLNLGKCSHLHRPCCVAEVPDFRVCFAKVSKGFPVGVKARLRDDRFLHVACTARVRNLRGEAKENVFEDPPAGVPSIVVRGSWYLHRLPRSVWLHYVIGELEALQEEKAEVGKQWTSAYGDMIRSTILTFSAAI